MTRILTILLGVLIGLGAATSTVRAQDAGPAFHEQVDLDPIGGLAVHVQGRIKSFGSHANAMMDMVSGPRSIAGQSPTFTYLDMLFRPDAYRDADVVYIKNKLVRNSIADAIVERDESLVPRIDVFRADPRTIRVEYAMRPCSSDESTRRCRHDETRVHRMPARIDRPSV